MKKIILFILIALTFDPIFGQQNAMFSQYMFNGVAINPAYAGSSGVTSLTALHRNQWLTIKGSPKTSTLTMDAPLLKERLGLAVSIYNDKIGVTNNWGIYTCYAYRIRFKKSTLAMGLQMGINRFVADFQSLDLAQTSDAEFAENIKNVSPNFGAGIYYHSQKFYAGFSVPQLVKDNLFNKDNISTFKQSKHFFVTTGYVFDLNHDYKLRPSILVKIVDNAPIEWDMNLLLWMFNTLGIGVSYRTGDSFDVLAEVRLNQQISIGYAYDYTVTDLGKYTPGTHEIMLRYNFSYIKSRILTPRYF